MSAIQLQSLNKFYDGGVHVVKDVNLEIEDGEMVVLVGPSGCGKSTTLRMIAGLETITTGDIRIGGKVVNDLAPRDRDIAMVFQSYALYPHMSVFENMAFALKLRKVPSQEIESKVRKAAEMLDIGHLLERKPGQLSGGQRQRVALGRAIIRNPQCFLFDEPLSNLDARLRIDTRAELRRLHRRLEATAVYVTHDQEEAMTLGDRVVVMKDGVIQQVGRPLDIYDRPANRFVAGFLGSPPMNFLEGKITVGGGQAVFVEDSSSDTALRLELGDRYASLGQRDIVVGVRAEAIAPKDGAAFAVEHSPVQATIELVQPLGDRMTGVWNTAGGQRCVGQFEARSPVREGDQIELAFDLNRLNFFAADDEGARIELPA